MFLATGILLLFLPFTLYGQIRFNRFDRSNGLPQINVVSIYQDEAGVMWFGTISGLCRYNGTSTQTFRSSPEYPELTKNNILSITGNRNGAIYIRTEYDLIKYDIAEERFHRMHEGVTGMCYGNGKLWFIVGDSIYSHSEQDGTISYFSDMEGIGSSRMAMCISDEGHIWAGGRNGLVSIKNTKEKNIRKVLLKNTYVYSLHIDSEGFVWAGTNGNGVYVLDAEGEIKWHFHHRHYENSISNDFVRNINEDERGTIWAATAFGLNSYDKNTGLWTNHIPDDAQPGALSDYSVFAIYRDAQNTMWIGTYYGGVNYFNYRSDIFTHYASSLSKKERLSFPFVGKMTQDKEGNLWICTEGGGLNCLDMRTRKFTRYYYNEYDLEQTSEYHLKSICHDPRTDKLYIGLHDVGLWVFDIATRKGVLYNNVEWAGRNMMLWRGTVVVQTTNGLFRIDPRTDTLVPLSDDPVLTGMLNRERIYNFFIDSRDRIWLASNPGLKYIDLNSGEQKEFFHDSTNPRSASKATVISFVETKSGEIFFVTLGAGLFRYAPDTGDFDNYTEANKTQFSDFGYHISEMAGGNLLILHNNSFSIFSPLQSTTVYRSTDNFPILGFFEGNSSYTTREGEIFFGGINGLASVEETHLAAISSPDYTLYFDKLTVNGEPVKPGDATGILSKTLQMTDRIRLRHNMNNISIEFGTSNYSSNGNISGYEYRLEGLDMGWSAAPSGIISYTNIDPGRYRLSLREISPEKSDAEKKIRSVDITISPPFYRTTFAYILYVLLFVASIVGIILSLMWRYRMRTTLEMERKEKENIERLNRMKLGFFTGVSHEFRTPLTLIMAQTEHILSSHELAPALKRDVSKVFDNASHMRDLISELLDFRKAEQGFYRLKVAPVDLVPYIGDIFRSFTEYADKHRIKYVYDLPHDKAGETGTVEAYIDRAQLKKAIYNLLSNAFKYTSDGGEITVRLRVDEYIHIEVEDNGIGISSNELTKIFERFYQVEYRTSGFSLGTGIGLALTKEIIENHKGEISVRSTMNKGSVFEIKLRRGYSHFDSVELSQNPVADEEVRENALFTTPTTPSTLTTPPVPDMAADGEPSDNRPSMLIVEDNEQMLALLSEIFSGEYTVYTAENGKQGLEMAEEHLPDLIISDVMMPEMTGKEMCYSIKNNIKLSHIPVVMLTSLDSEDETVEGFMFGADDYVTKPFNVEILKARCGSIVRSRHLLYRTIAESRDMDGIEVQSEQNRKFIGRVIEIIRANFDNEAFDMNMLASELGMGRNKLYISMKDISGMTPNEFTLTVKLRESTQLLKNHTHLNISEIADRLGFSTTKYFSKCFKTFYGVSPVQWRKNNGDDSAPK